VVLEVPGKPVELVDHEEVDARILSEPGEHRLELRPVDAPRGLAPVDVVVGELPATIGDEAAAGLGLGGDGVAPSACSLVETRR